ncbi:unnamed protein product [Lasius platythorax]|uniref:Uncharacterized protein n=1 Tax=Lasius platythorax TaxID=488582 RepID=A0AAV2NKH2_9HYME
MGVSVRERTDVLGRLASSINCTPGNKPPPLIGSEQTRLYEGQSRRIIRPAFPDRLQAAAHTAAPDAPLES